MPTAACLKSSTVPGFLWVSAFKQHRCDAYVFRRWRPERIERLHAIPRDVPNLRRANNLPLGIAALQLGYLQFVARAYPLTRKRIAEAEGVQLEPAHHAIPAQ